MIVKSQQNRIELVTRPGADQERRPKAAKKARRPSNATAHEEEEEEEEIVEPEEMSKFAEELRQTSRQQLGKKRQRVGVAPR